MQPLPGVGLVGYPVGLGLTVDGPSDGSEGEYPSPVTAPVAGFV